MRRISLCVLLFSAASGLDVARAELIGFQFTGTLFQEGTVFGSSFDAQDNLSGYVIYDTSSLPTNLPAGCDDCAGYRQDVTAGFYLVIGPLELWANSYLVSVVNNQAGLFPGTLEDVLVFEHRLAFQPPLIDDLVVNGERVPQGAISVALTGSDTVFSSSALPTDPAAASFPRSSIAIEDGSTGSLLLGFVDFGSLRRFDVLAGDLDLDEAVSQSDFALWADNYASLVSPRGDANRDGWTDAADYTRWRDALEDDGSAIPEPTSAVVFATTMLLCRVVRFGA